jgi:SAM-dependent methyltransferase
MPFDVSDEGDPRTSELEQRLRCFYGTDSGYFDSAGDKPEIWGPIRAELSERVARHGTCRVFEFGAGRSGFGPFLGELRSRVQYEVQDVTDLNLALLSSRADRVHVGSVLDLGGCYDVIFSTFVWEHVSRPRATLHHLLDLLDRRGTLFLVSPRYDFPGYIPPSARHLSKSQQTVLAAWLLARRLHDRLTRAPSFMIHQNPAAFRVPWFRDADAVHWPSIIDLRYELGDAYTLRRVRISTESWRQFLWAWIALLYVRIDSRAAQRNSRR